MIEAEQNRVSLIRELEDLHRRVQELEDSELQRISDEQERFDSLQVLDEYAKQLEESRDKLMRLFKAAADVQEAKTVQDALEKVAHAVKQAGWGSVSVGLYDNFEIVQSAYAGCTTADIEFLETHRRPAAERARMYGPEFDCFRMSRSYFVPGDRLAEVMSLENVCPGRREVQPGDEWDPMDLAYVPLYGANDSIIGSINCDDPVDGKRPTREVFFYLELFAELVAHKVETGRLLEQKLVTEEALRQSETHYRTVFNHSGDSFFVLDQVFRDCNEKACHLLGCTREDIVGHVPAEHSPPYQPNGSLSTVAAEAHISRALSGTPQTFPWTHKRKDGTLIDCEVSLTSMRIGSEDLLFAVVRDETERRRAERAIRQSEERFRKIFEDSPIGMMISSPEGRYIHVNEAFCRILGYSANELIGKSFAEVTHPEDLSESFQSLHQLITGAVDNQSLEKRYVHKHGHTIWASVNLSAIRDESTGTIHLVTQIQDISERKRAELERETVVRILRIASTATQPGALIDQIFREVGQLVPAENRFLALYDVKKAMISFPYFVDEMDQPPAPVPLGKGLTAWVIRHGRALRLGPQDFERLANSGEIELLGSPAFSWLGVPLIANSGIVGALVVQSYKSTSVFDANHERVLSVVASQIASVIERQRSEEDLLKLKRAVQAAGDVIFLTDTDGTITFANPEFTRLYGYRVDEIVGKVTPRILRSGILPQPIYEDLWRKLTSGRVFKGEMVNRTKDGKLVCVEASANPVLDEDGKIIGFLAAQRDITAQKAVSLALQRKTNELQSIFRALPDLYFRLAGDGTILDYQAGSESDLYTTPDKFLGKRFEQVLPVEVGRQFSSALERVRVSNAPVVLTYDLLIANQNKTFEARVLPLQPDECITVIRNITESRHTLDALKESELRFRVLADAVPVMIWMSNIDRRFIYVNRVWEKFTGQNSEQAKGDGWSSVVHPEDLSRLVSTYRAAFERRMDFSIRCRLRRQDGVYPWILMNGRPRETSQGRFVGYIGTCTDVTDRLGDESERF
jgi:PAS domain S-box-containing protein